MLFGRLTKSELPKFYHGIRANQPIPLFLTWFSLLLVAAHSPHWQCLEEALQELLLQTFLRTPHLHFFFSIRIEHPTQFSVHSFTPNTTNKHSYKYLPNHIPLPHTHTPKKKKKKKEEKKKKEKKLSKRHSWPQLAFSLLRPSFFCSSLLGA